MDGSAFRLLGYLQREEAALRALPHVGQVFLVELEQPGQGQERRTVCGGRHLVVTVQFACREAGQSTHVSCS